jgi:hypothetical protein
MGDVLATCRPRSTRSWERELAAGTGFGFGAWAWAALEKSRMRANGEASVRDSDRHGAAALVVAARVQRVKLRKSSIFNPIDRMFAA